MTQQKLQAKLALIYSEVWAGLSPGSALAQPIAAQALGLQWVGLRAQQLCDGLEPIGLRSHQKCPSPAQTLPSGTLIEHNG